MKYFTLLILCTAILISSGCSLTRKDAFFRDSSVLVSSCPSNVSLTVNGQQCVTPCTLTITEDINLLEVTYNDRTTVVSTGSSGFSEYGLAGQLIIMNVDNIGKPASGPDSVYFLRDYEINAVDFCGK